MKRHLAFATMCSISLLLSGCMVGPKYVKPTVPMAPAFKEQPPQSFKESDKNKEIADEMADVLWVLMCLANQTGVDLTKALLKNIEKKSTRDANRHQDNEKIK